MRAQWEFCAIITYFTACRHALKEGLPINNPNIIFIITDTQRTDALGTHQRKKLATPNIDNLAEEEIEFPRRYTTIPDYTPTRSRSFTEIHISIKIVISMIIDIRFYQTRPGMREEHFKLFSECGLAIQSQILGSPYSYVKSIEDPNEYILMWSYENLKDRQEKRAKMMSDPDWIKYATRSKKLGAVVSQYNKLVELV